MFNSNKDILQKYDDYYLECQYCGSHDVGVGIPDTTDLEHIKMEYYCRCCGETNTIDCRIVGIDPETETLEVAVGPMLEEPKLLLV